jgi:hypothetical protein
MIGYSRSSYLPRQCGHFEPIFDRFGPQTPELCHIYCTVRAGDEPVRHGAAIRYGPRWFRVVVGTCTGPGEPLGGPGYRLTAWQLPHRPSNGDISTRILSLGTTSFDRGGDTIYSYTFHSIPIVFAVSVASTGGIRMDLMVESTLASGWLGCYW